MFIVLNLCWQVINIDIIMWNFYSVYFVNKQLGNNCFMLYLYSLVFVWFIFYHNSKVHGIRLLWKVIFTICNTIGILIYFHHNQSYCSFRFVYICIFPQLHLILLNYLSLPAAKGSFYIRTNSAHKLLWRWRCPPRMEQDALWALRRHIAFRLKGVWHGACNGEGGKCS